MLHGKPRNPPHEAVLRLLAGLGIENGWVQEMGAAEEYLPDFDREGHPFSNPTVIATPSTQRHECWARQSRWLNSNL
jgi:hypothetical protein